MKPYAIGLYEKAMPESLVWREKLACAQGCGYDYLEISIDETEGRLSRLDWSAKQRLDLIEAMQETGIPVRSMCLSGHRKYALGSSNAAVRARGMEIMEKALRLADDLGIRTIQLAGYDVYYEPGTPESEHLFRQNLRQCIQMAATAGVMLGFETMETTFMDTVGKAMKYVDLMDNPYLGVYPDTGNLTNAAKLRGHSVLEDIRCGTRHILAVHLKETAPGKYREVPFFTGHVDFEAVISEAWRQGVRRFVTEMWDVGSPAWQTDIRHANRRMRDILDRQSQWEEDANESEQESGCQPGQVLRPGQAVI